MPDKTCADCKFFIQHYRKQAKKYFPINCGHCTEPRIKTRAPITKACEHFQENRSVM